MAKIQGTIQVSLTSRDDYKVVTQNRCTDIVVPVQGTDVIITIPKGLVMQFAADVVRDQLHDCMPPIGGLIRIRRIV